MAGLKEKRSQPGLARWVFFVKLLPVSQGDYPAATFTTTFEPVKLEMFG